MIFEKYKAVFSETEGAGKGWIVVRQGRLVLSHFGNDGLAAATVADALNDAFAFGVESVRHALRDALGIQPSPTS